MSGASEYRIPERFGLHSKATLVLLSLHCLFRLHLLPITFPKLHFLMELQRVWANYIHGENTLSFYYGLGQDI